MNNYPNERGVRNNNIAPVGGPTFGESPASGPAPTTSGHHKHDILNKLDPRIDSTKDNRPIATNNSIPDGTYGPHSSRLANKLDPRVDSDLDSRGPRTANAAMGGPTMRGAAGPGANYNTTNNNNNNIPEGTYGPHSSRMANTLDPRVDSDADRHHAGGMMGTTGAGYGNTGYSQQQQPHHQGGMFSNTGTTATAPGTAGYGTSNMMSGPGPAPKTAGPHKSDLLNKLDPRVDSKTGEVSGSYGAGTTGGVQGTGGRYA